MTIARSLTNPFTLTDWTEDLVTIPNQWSLVNDSGLFAEEGVTQHNVTIEEYNKTLSLVGDSVRGAGRNKVNKDENRKLHSLPIPHFNLQDYITPSDIQGKRAYGNTNAAETEAAVMLRKMDRINRVWAATLEAARCQAITAGTVYAPNGTVSVNYFTEFGYTQTTQAFQFSSATANIQGAVEAVIAAIQDGVLTGSTVTAVRFYCSPEFFSALTQHTKVAQAYLYFSSNAGNNPNRDRLGGQGLFRRFEWAGAEFVEYRGVFNGNRLIPASEAYAVPLGTSDMFVTYFGPAEKFSTVNTVGERAYLWTMRDAWDEKVEIFTESNFLNLIRRPQAVIKCTMT